MRKDIAKEKELKELYWNKIEELVGKEKTEQMKQGSTFKGELDLQLKSLDGHGCKILAPALAKMTPLNFDSLSSKINFNNNIGDKGAKHLEEALKGNTSLETIFLDLLKYTTSKIQSCVFHRISCIA